MKLLGFFIIYFLNGEIAMTTKPVDCDKFFAATDDHKRWQIARTFCHYTNAPATSPLPVARPWKGTT